MPKPEFIDEIVRICKGLKAAEAEGLLFIISRDNSEISFSELSTLTGIPRETLHLFKKSISAYIEEDYSEGIRLKKESRHFMGEMGFRPFSWALVSLNDVTLENRIDEIRNSATLKPKRDLDQFFATTSTVVSKAIILSRKGMLSGKEIAFLGDDDLNSIAVELLDPGYKSITVFDIDADLLKEISNTSTKGVRTILHDFRLDIPKLYQDQFDVVVTDPPYTTTGIKMFLNRAIELLGKVTIEDNKYIFLYYGNSFKSPEKTLKIQEILVEMGLLVEDKIDKFARYRGAESIGNTSSLYILKLTPNTRKLDVSNVENIYTYQDRTEEKFPYVDHFVCKLSQVDQKFLRSRGNLLKALDKFAKQHNLKVVDRVVTEFKGGGLTVTLVLATSNLTVHTWPEFNALHIDLITCTPLYNRDNLRNSLKSVFGEIPIQIRKIE